MPRVSSDVSAALIGSLPHQPPMRLIDDVIEIEHGEQAAGRRHAGSGDFYFQGHFPGEPIVPAVILVEMIAQIGGIAAAAPPLADTIADTEQSILAQSRQSAAPALGNSATRAAAGSGAALQLRVAAIGPFKFPAAATAGATLEARARIVGRIAGLFKIEGTVTADGVLVATGSVTLASR